MFVIEGFKQQDNVFGAQYMYAEMLNAVRTHHLNTGLSLYIDCYGVTMRQNTV